MIGKTNIGSGGNLTPTKPLIHVNAPAGSSVTFALDGGSSKTIPSNKAFSNSDNVSADYYYTATNGTYTITATLSQQETTETMSKRLTVTTNKEYEVVLYQRVPKEFQAVEYLQSDASQQFIFLDLNVPNPMTSIKADITFQQVGDNTSYVIGHQINSPYFAVYINGNGTTLGARANADSFSTATISSAKTTKRRIQYEDGYFKYEGQQIFNFSSYSDNLISKIALMGMLTAETTTATIDSNSRMRIYEAKFSIGNTSFDLVPCYHRKTSQKGFWDRANNVFRISEREPFNIVGPNL